MRRLLACLLAALPVLGGCGSDGEPAAQWHQPQPITTPVSAPPLSLPTPLAPWSLGEAFSTSRPIFGGTSRSAGKSSGGWEVTVYYTAVEEYHHGDPVSVTGCPVLACKNGDSDLGEYPADFVRAVQDEGTGRTSEGKYLNWSYDTGYWLDTATRDSYGRPLEAFVSAAADPDVLARGTRFTIAGCGRTDDGSAPPAAVCARLKAANWLVTDEFTPGLGGSKHIDAYIGAETGPGFTDSDWYITLQNATLSTVD